MPQTPLDQNVAAALSRFFTGGWGPTHAELDEIFARNLLTHLDPRRTEPEVTKEVRVRTVFTEAVTARPEIGGRLVGTLLARMRVRGCFDPESGHDPSGGDEAVNELRNAEGTGHGRIALPTVSAETARSSCRRQGC
jgi:hypothetical protein